MGKKVLDGPQEELLKFYVGKAIEIDARADLTQKDKDGQKQEFYDKVVRAFVVCFGWKESSYKAAPGAHFCCEYDSIPGMAPLEGEAGKERREFVAKLHKRIKQWYACERQECTTAAGQVALDRRQFARVIHSLAPPPTMPQALTVFQRDHKERWLPEFEAEWQAALAQAQSDEDRQTLTDNRVSMARKAAARVWRVEMGEEKAKIEAGCKREHEESMKTYNSHFGSPWAALPNSNAWIAPEAGAFYQALADWTGWRYGVTVGIFLAGKADGGQTQSVSVYSAGPCRDDVEVPNVTEFLSDKSESLRNAMRVYARDYLTGAVGRPNSESWAQAQGGQGLRDEELDMTKLKTMNEEDELLLHDTPPPWWPRSPAASSSTAAAAAASGASTDVAVKTVVASSAGTSSLAVRAVEPAAVSPSASPSASGVVGTSVAGSTAATAAASLLRSMTEAPVQGEGIGDKNGNEQEQEQRMVAHRQLRRAGSEGENGLGAEEVEIRGGVTRVEGRTALPLTRTLNTPARPSASRQGSGLFGGSPATGSLAYRKPATPSASPSKSLLGTPRKSASSAQRAERGPALSDEDDDEDDVDDLFMPFEHRDEFTLPLTLPRDRSAEAEKTDEMVDRERMGGENSDEEGEQSTWMGVNLEDLGADIPDMGPLWQNRQRSRSRSSCATSDGEDGGKPAKKKQGSKPRPHPTVQGRKGSSVAAKSKDDLPGTVPRGRKPMRIESPDVDDLPSTQVVRDLRVMGWIRDHPSTPQDGMSGAMKEYCNVHRSQLVSLVEHLDVETGLAYAELVDAGEAILGKHATWADSSRHLPEPRPDIVKELISKRVSTLDRDTIPADLTVQLRSYWKSVQPLERQTNKKKLSDWSRPTTAMNWSTLERARGWKGAAMLILAMAQWIWRDTTTDTVTEMRSWRRPEEAEVLAWCQLAEDMTTVFNFLAKESDGDRPSRENKGKKRAQEEGEAGTQAAKKARVGAAGKTKMGNGSAGGSKSKGAPKSAAPVSVATVSGSGRAIRPTWKKAY
ncbi:hypothetical protein PENSPDRAFT_694608 [Peniophora sp. CONT]|nr:hypothetical protein PENSPDRAFT_694608 [Peniophora sp. CONT]